MAEAAYKGLTEKTEEDAVEIKELVKASKYGDWDKVWEILGPVADPKREYLINVIPEGRRWGLLHQAVYSNSMDNLQRLLRYPGCDHRIKTKNSTFTNGEVGMKTPLEIAEMYRYWQMASKLKEPRQTMDDQEVVSYFYYHETVRHLQNFRLFEVVLAAYKDQFHPSSVPPGVSMIEIMKTIFSDIEQSDERFALVKDAVCESLHGRYAVFKDKVKESRTREEFYGSVIWSYTVESDEKLYSHINLALRRQKVGTYRPTANDLAIGPFVLIYQIILMNWRKLQRESETTYRKMKVTDETLKSYTVGLKFVWPAITSSTTVMEKTNIFPTAGPSGDHEVVFEIDNSERSLWQPRNIEKQASYEECERAYPAGCAFQIMQKRKKGKEEHILIKLLKN